MWVSRAGHTPQACPPRHRRPRGRRRGPAERGRGPPVLAQAWDDQLRRPGGQIAIMHDEFVERRRWIGERRFLHALNFCIALPGPEAQQLASYIGYSMYGVREALTAGGLFVLPSFVLLCVMSAIYVEYGEVAAVAGIVRGLGAAVI